MSARRIIVVELRCDTCDEVDEWVGVRSVERAVEHSRGQGWVSYKVSRRWVTHCPMCAEKAGM